MIDPVDLRAFVRIAECGSVSAAARMLRLPKSSVSRSLARLEQEVGSILVERSTRHLRLTDAGLLLQPHAFRILDEIEAAQDALGGVADSVRGALRINLSFATAQALVAPMLPGFLSNFPDLRVILDVDVRRIDLFAEDVDIVIRPGFLEDSDLVARKLTDVELQLCAGPRYLASRGTPLSVGELRQHDLVGRQDRKTTWVFRGEDGEAESLTFTPRVAASEPATTAAMLVAGVGIGLLPDFLAGAGISAGDLVRVLPDLACGSAAIHALYPRHRTASGKIRVFIDALAVYLNDEHK